MINLDNVDRPAILAEVTAAFYQYEEALVSNNIEALDALFWHDPRTVRLGAGEICMASRRSAPFAPPPAAGLAAICAIPPLPPLVRIWRCAAPSSPARAAPAWAASSRPGYVPLRLADCRRPGQSDGLSGVYGADRRLGIRRPLPVR
ncbi:Protein of uncharacterised function (DUF3225) [Klebsiella pneumoniae]|uniref:Protein of uncharacterized function (DUF3225) n=1 Tax=Klebsiella pneumoniae TaxID=573 RepID=A0A2X3F543_KLEPN|nr:Protein of uncharacterised function (DUF3225) [Klebsiella pneumoniae]